MIDHYGPAFAFWLNYLDSHGGLWEQAGDTVLAILPEHLSTKHGLPETALIPDDPDIAREDGVLFLGAGHPEIDKGAETIIDSGDVGALTVPHSAKPLSTEDLLAKIRDQVPVDHGRIDGTNSIIRSHRPLLRLGALVSHTVSADEQFTEVAECLIDVPSRITWTQDATARLRGAMATAEAAPRPDVSTNRLAPAVAAAHRELDTAAGRRGGVLATEADTERAAEIGRASEYYAAALAAIDKRRDGADAQRQVLLDARALATIGERDRRLAEINEKYRHRHALRPYRLHLVDLPVWRLATDVRRGERRWPMVFDYLPLLGIVAPTRCPTCDAHSPLVATKTHLGCGSCVPAKAPVRLPPVVGKPRAVAVKGALDRTKAEVAPATAQRRQPRDNMPVAERKQPVPLAAQHAAPVSSAVRPVPTQLFLPGKPEERKVVDFWNHLGAGDNRKLSRLIAPDSPLAALIRLYGSAGPLNGIGVPIGHTPVKFTCGNYDRPVAGQRGGTAGELHTHHGEYRYLLLWSPDRLLEEVFPYSAPWHLGRSQGFFAPVTQVPATHVDLDVVAQLLLSHTTARHGLTFAARALAAWWRLPDPDSLLARFSPRVLAGTMDRAIRYWSGAPQAGYLEAAAVFKADQADMRKATPMLQKQLQLNSTRNW
ncbi:MAG: hypothetical protein M3443_03095 [Actinomycetota bacterium]|nr:hypothetical protein [Actinomycetota bacterium]